MTKKKTIKFTKAQQAAIDKTRSSPLMVTYQDGDKKYTFADGTNISAKIAKSIINKGGVKATEGGLLPGCTQTYTAV